MLSQASKIAVSSLEIQLQTSTKVVELTKTLGTMAEITKEAAKVAAQVADVLEMIKTSQDNVDTMRSLADDVKLLTTRAQGTSSPVNHEASQLKSICVTRI